ncbi:hypothetical protein BE08_43125 [Sorangium cellulosum]|uniref:Uncharacterized protein n=1 Tax=Sorangium cellulosum TaxID=56 RepID=A0A150P1Q9_SORCE|nr:hypothetical protein BE08_43125 [Sorangium cellulosum]
MTEVELFVAVLGASNYTYAEATRSQKLADFVGSTVRMLEYFGCVPEMLVLEQLRRCHRAPWLMDGKPSDIGLLAGRDV